MSDPKGQGEPTMEEILASIRKIISEDGEEEAENGQQAVAEAVVDEDPVPEEVPAEPDVPEEPEPEPAAPEAEVLDLTQMVNEDGSVVDLDAERAQKAAEAASEPEPEPEPEEVSFDEVEAEPEAPADDELELAEQAPEPETADLADLQALVSDETRGAATASLVDLAASAGIGFRDAPAPAGGGQSLEALVRDALRPYLKAWLDDNLADLVDRIVREEIQKMIKRAEYR